jgi:hypothetical protein
MKLAFFSFFTLIYFSGISQEIEFDSTYTEIAYFENDRPLRLIDWGVKDNRPYLCGRYIEFDSCGTVLVFGQYRIENDSVTCKDCYIYHELDSTYLQTKKVICRELRHGIWQFYHSNGNIKKEGYYSNKVHTEWGTTLIIRKKNSNTSGLDIYGPYSNGFHYNYLEHGCWPQYNELGEIQEQIWYFDGSIIERKYAPRD